MLLTITTTHRPATDLGPLLHQHLDTIHSASFPFGQVLVCFSQADENRCTAGVMLQAHPAFPSYLAVALAEVFGDALRGRPAAPLGSGSGPVDEHGNGNGDGKVRGNGNGHRVNGEGGTGPDEVTGRPLPFEVEVPVLPCPAGPRLVRRLFTPLGYHVAVSPVASDPRFPSDGGDGDLAVRLTGIVRLADLLSHLCVLLPVVDDRSGRHRDDPRVGDLLAHGQPWVGGHPEAALIAHRYAGSRPRRVGAGHAGGAG